MLLELPRSLKEALRILAGVAGPIFIASFALQAWVGVPPMPSVTLPLRQGLALWTAQAVPGAWRLWALRRRRLPEPWCVQLRCLPLKPHALAASDVAVRATLLAPLAALTCCRWLCSPGSGAAWSCARARGLACPASRPLRRAAHLADTVAARAAQGGQVCLLTSHVEPHVPVRDAWVLD